MSSCPKITFSVRQGNIFVPCHFIKPVPKEFFKNINFKLRKFAIDGFG